MSSLPHRPGTASSSSVFPSSTTPSSRTSSLSPSRKPSMNNIANDGAISPGRPTTATSHIGLQAQRQYDPRSLILRSFVPHIAIHASPDTDRLAQEKGFEDGFWELLRPFGEQVHGKVTIRDSVGASRSWEDFGVRFVKLGDGVGDRRTVDRRSQEENDLTTEPQTSRSSRAAALRTGGDLDQIEELLDRHVSYAESISGGYGPEPPGHNETNPLATPTTSPFYTLYLRRLLSGIPISPHETFPHPVACIIAISSRTPAPIEALRQLYESTIRGDSRLPQWVNGDYLRYYVLIHDEDRDDIAKSTALFEQMKRHFGLHCHLLRLRSSQCVLSDDDSVPMPVSEWVSAAEELAEMRRKERSDDGADLIRCLYESDLTAVRTFVRELVTQSVVPFMERCSVTWNDQVASRKRGLSGRFISLSKKWTGFGSSSRSGSASSSPGGPNTNYDGFQGFYRPDAPEAIIRKLADYAFMLRDWKLAYTTYDMLRADFQTDKAWKYYAGANEMAAISTLLVQQTLTAKYRAETVDQMLDTASYSYLSRCGAPYNALRCLALGAELLKGRGGSAADDAARWETRIFELRLLGPIGNALFTQQVAACYAVRKGAGSKGWGSRVRKAAFWNILAASAWLELGKWKQAKRCLDQASGVYSVSPRDDGLSSFAGIQAFIGAMVRELESHTTSILNNVGDSMEGSDEALGQPVSEEEGAPIHRNHRKSLIGPGSSLLDGPDSSSLNAGGSTEKDVGVQSDPFGIASFPQ
ncbi:MAG: hypothetical protein M1816_001401 [Peltula sp. TS41687]|nr:MAG: hypothetical protein M1816_001401 [Peltula sp. TS41687]